MNYVSISGIYNSDQLSLVFSALDDIEIRNIITVLNPDMNTGFRIISCESQHYEFVLNILSDTLSITPFRMGNHATFDIDQYDNLSTMYANGVRAYYKGTPLNVTELLKESKDRQMYFHRGYIDAIGESDWFDSPAYSLYVSIFIEGDKYFSDNIYKIGVKPSINL